MEVSLLVSDRVRVCREWPAGEVGRVIRRRMELSRRRLTVAAAISVGGHVEWSARMRILCRFRCR